MTQDNRTARERPQAEGYTGYTQTEEYTQREYERKRNEEDAYRLPPLSVSELRREARELSKRRRGLFPNILLLNALLIFPSLILYSVSALNFPSDSISYIFFQIAAALLPVILGGPFALGLSGSFLGLSRGETKIRTSSLFYGLKDRYFPRAFCAFLLTALISAIVLCLLLLPGTARVYLQRTPRHLLLRNLRSGCRAPSCRNCLCLFLPAPLFSDLLVHGGERRTQDDFLHHGRIPRHAGKLHPLFPADALLYRLVSRRLRRSTARRFNLCPGRVQPGFLYGDTLRPICLSGLPGLLYPYLLRRSDRHRAVGRRLQASVCHSGLFQPHHRIPASRNRKKKRKRQKQRQRKQSRRRRMQRICRLRKTMPPGRQNRIVRICRSPEPYGKAGMRIVRLPAAPR